jgi:MarR family 2-MHQ and catechol resistance regulon transcriptional repressor
MAAGKARQVSEREKKSRALRAYRELLFAADLLRERMSRQLESWDLTIAQLDVLESLERDGSQYPAALSRKFHCSLQNMMTVVYRLEKLGLVNRTAANLPRVDGKPGQGVRVVRVGLTLEGKRLVAKVAPKHARVVKAEMRALEGREQSTLARLCGKLKEGDPVAFMREMMRQDPEEEA